MKMKLHLISALAGATAVFNLVQGSTSSQLESCPGYSASNIATTGNTLTADLNLAGPVCNTFGQDLANLKLFVQYETGTPIRIPEGRMS
jgi:alpha-glucosidase